MNIWNAFLGTKVRRGVACINGAQNVKCWYPLYDASETTKILMEVFSHNLANVNTINNALIGPAAVVTGSGPGSFLSDGNADAGNNIYWANPDTTFLGLLGSAIVPSHTFKSEQSLGWYRSAASTMALSYGTLVVPSGLTTGGVFSLGTVRASQLTVSAGVFDRDHTNAAAYVFMQPATVRGANIAQTYFYNGTASGGGWNIAFSAPNSGSAATEYARLGGTVQDSTAGAELGEMVFATMQTGKLLELARFNRFGQVSASSGVQAIKPAFAYQSELSLGWYRSGASVMALSYGGLGVKNGTNASFGTAALGSNGSVNVATTYVAAGDVIFLTDQTAGGTLGDIELGGIRAGSGFTILSTSITDTSTVGWLIVRPT